MTAVGVRQESRGDMAERLRAKAQRLGDLRPADPEALDEFTRENADKNFDPSHRFSRVSVSNGRMEIGSTSPHYLRLLHMPAERIASVYRRHVHGS